MNFALQPQLFRYLDEVYILSPDERSLVKAAKNWRESTEYTDSQGRKWLFNTTTRRWGLHPDHKKPKGKGKRRKQEELPEPPKDDYKDLSELSLEELFAEADKINTDYDAASDKVHKLIDEVKSGADSLDEASNEILDETPEEYSNPALEELARQADKINSKYDSLAKETRELMKDYKNGVNPLDMPPSDEPFMSQKEFKVFEQTFDVMNNIMPINLTKQREVNQVIRQIQREIEHLYGLNKEAAEEAAHRGFMETLRSMMEGIDQIFTDSKDILDSAHRRRIEGMERAYSGRVDRLTARRAALDKRLFEILNPRKLIRFPKGTTQREYADIMRRISDGDKAAIKQYTVAKLKQSAKKKRTSKNTKSKKLGKGLMAIDGSTYALVDGALIKSNEPIKYVMPWWKIQLGVTHDPGDKRHGKPMKAGYGHIRGSYGDAEDGMSLDVYIGDDLGSHQVFKVKQVKPDTEPPELDEYKYIIGCWNKQQATDLYLAHMPKRFYGGIESVDLKSLARYQK